MEQFPALSNSAGETCLPLCDTTALELGQALLVAPDAAASEIIVESLRWDPFLVLWCVCRADEYFDRIPSPDEIAEWFLSHGIAHVRSASAASAELKCKVEDLIETAVASAMLASRATPRESSADSQRTYVLALLTETTARLGAFAEDDQADSPAINSQIPAWLAKSLSRIHSDQELPDACSEADVRRSHLAVGAGIDKLDTGDRRLVREPCRQALSRFHAESPAGQSFLPFLSNKLSRLKELEGEFQATLRREKLASLKQLAYGASHEINNPLANISTRAQTLLRSEEDPERRRQLATINSQAFRAHEMIADMMLFAHPPRLNLEPTDVYGLLERVIEELGSEAERQSTRLSIETNNQPPSWNIDPVQMTVALKAMVRNSIEVLGSGGQVVVSLRFGSGGNGAESELEISVTDDGPGISAAAAKHLFDPFFSGREAGRGLGFGLAKCWRIVELHGGKILVDSRPGCGATFTIRLPRTARGEGLTADPHGVRIEH